MNGHQRNPIVWFEIYVQDMERAKAFYEAVFVTKLEKMPAPTAEMNMEMWSFPADENTAKTTYGACGMLVKMDGVPSGFGGTLIYFGCEDCAVEAMRAAENGGSIFKEKMSIGEHGFIALVIDTEGNMIGLYSIVTPIRDRVIRGFNIFKIRTITLPLITPTRAYRIHEQSSISFVSLTIDKLPLTYENKSANIQRPLF